jgi:hypothetical protein
MKIVGSTTTIIEGIETLTPNKEMPDIIDKIEEINSTQLLTFKIFIFFNISIWENEALVYTETIQQVFMKIKNEVNAQYMKVNRKKQTASNMKERIGQRSFKIITLTTS